MDKFKIGEVVHLEVTHTHKNGETEKGVIVFEYLGRGLNALLKLNLNDDYLTISEDGKTVNYNLGYLDEHDRAAYDNDVNEYRAMTGKLIHAYGLSDETLLNFTDYLCDKYIDAFTNTWITDAKIPKKYHKKIKSGDSITIEQLMEKYKKIPPTDEELKEIEKHKIEATISFGGMKDKHGNVIPVLFFGDGTDPNRIHPYTIINGHLTVQDAGDVNHWLNTHGVELDEVKLIRR